MKSETQCSKALFSDGPLDVGCSLMHPVQPMLAMACKSVDMAFEKCPNGMYAEIKYDGERVQLHKQGDQFKYYSRSLKPVLPHKVSESSNSSRPALTRPCCVAGEAFCRVHTESISRRIRLDPGRRGLDGGQQNGQSPALWDSWQAQSCR